ncbi:hypothetical protein MRX96_026433 [Rhipicephalus microplus]
MVSSENEANLCRPLEQARSVCPATRSLLRRGNAKRAFLPAFLIPLMHGAPQTSSIRQSMSAVKGAKKFTPEKRQDVYRWAPRRIRMIGKDDRGASQANLHGDDGNRPSRNLRDEERQFRRPSIADAAPHRRARVSLPSL